MFVSFFAGDDSGEGFDKNLNVDWIEVDATRVETESPYVFSTGVFSAQTQSIEQGFGLGANAKTQTDILNTRPDRLSRSWPEGIRAPKALS